MDRSDGDGNIFAVHDLALNFENAKVDFVKFFKNPISNEILLSLVLFASIC